MNAHLRSALGHTTGQQSPILNQNLSPTARNNISIINNKLDDLSERLASLEKSVASILKVVNKLANNKKKSTAPVEFPLQSLSAVEEIDKKIQNDTQKYVTLLRSLLMPEGIVKNLRRIIGKSIVMDLNYGGSCSKIALNSFQALNEALYEAVRREGYAFEDYIKDVRFAFARSKNCIYKAKCDMKKLNNQNQQANKDIQIEQVFVDEEEPEFIVDLIAPEEPKKKKRKTKAK